MINLVLNKMEETFQSNTLDWSSLVYGTIQVILITILRFILISASKNDEATLKFTVR